MPYLFSITYNGLSREYVRLLLVTEDPDELDWDGFQSLYRDYLHLQGSATKRDPLPICQDQPSIAQRRLDAGFLCNKDRAPRCFMDIRKAKEDFILACLSCLIRGNFTYSTPYDPRSELF